MTTYTHKMVDGVEVPLTQQEIIELEVRDAKALQKQQVSVSDDPGHGPTIKQTLT